MGSAFVLHPARGSPRLALNFGVLQREVYQIEFVTKELLTSYSSLCKFARNGERVAECFAPFQCSEFDAEPGIATREADLTMKSEDRKRSTRSKIVVALAGLIGTSMMLAGCSTSDSSSADPSIAENDSSIAEMDPVTLSMHVAVAPTHPQGVALQKLADDVAEKTEGKVTIEPYFSSSLLTSAEDLQGIGGGVADMGQVFATFHPEALPTLSWFTSMQSLRSSSTPHGFLQATAALQRMWTKSEPIAAEAEANNVVYLGGSSSATSIGLLCTKPIETPEDAKGVLVRTSGPVWTEEVKSMGFTPTVLSTSEMYEGLQRGVVDCDWSSPVAMASFSLWEVAKYYHPVAGSGSSSTTFAINKDTWSSLPGEVQEIIQAAANAYSLNAPEGAIAAYQAFAEQLDENGVTVVDPRPLNELLIAHQERVIEEELVRTAPAGVTDPEAFIEEWYSALEWGMEIAVDNVGSEPLESQSPDKIIEGYLQGIEQVDMPAFVAAVQEGL